MGTKTKRQSWMADFVETSVTDADKKAMKKLQVDGQTLVDTIDRMSDDGYKVTFRKDSRGDGVACWVQPVDDKAPNGKMILVGHGRYALGAALMAFYLHYVKFDQKWPEFHKEEELFYWDEVK